MTCCAKQGRWLVVGFCLAFPLSAAADDPLKRVSGTEGWRTTKNVETKTEWTQWLEARRSWREGRRMLRIEGGRNKRIARLLKRAQKPGAKELRDLRRRRRSKVRVRRGSGGAVVEPDYKVSVEKLDDEGQVIDVEGRSVLQKPRKRR